MKDFFKKHFPDSSNLEPELKGLFFKDLCKYIFFTLVGVFFSVSARNIYLSLFYFAMLVFLFLDRFSVYKEACANELFVIEGECMLKQGEKINIVGNLISAFGETNLDIMGTDGHVYIVPITKFKKYSSGDIIRVYASRRNVGKRDDDTFFISPYLYTKKIKNIDFTAAKK